MRCDESHWSAVAIQVDNADFAHAAAAAVITIISIASSSGPCHCQANGANCEWRPTTRITTNYTRLWSS